MLNIADIALALLMFLGLAIAAGINHVYETFWLNRK